MRNSQDTFETCKWLFMSAFSICMTVPSMKLCQQKENCFWLNSYVYCNYVFEGIALKIQKPEYYWWH